MSQPKLVLTKPEAQVAAWRPALEAEGWCVLSIPLLHLSWCPETAEHRSVVQNLAQFSGVIMISPSAAQWCVQQLDTWWPQAPTGIHWLGPGPGTAYAFHQNQHGLLMQCPTAGFRTEDLLALDSLQKVSQQQWLIIAGEGGRSKLLDVLTARGATVHRLSVYRRTPVRLNQEQRAHIEGLRPTQDVLYVSSQLALESLTSQLSEATTQSIDVLVSSPRLQQRAYQLGWQRVWQSGGASLATTRDALKRYRNVV